MVEEAGVPGVSIPSSPGPSLEKRSPRSRRTSFLSTAPPFAHQEDSAGDAAYRQKKRGQGTTSSRSGRTKMTISSHLLSFSGRGYKGMTMLSPSSSGDCLERVSCRHLPLCLLFRNSTRSHLLNKQAAQISQSVQRVEGQRRTSLADEGLAAFSDLAKRYLSDSWHHVLGIGQGRSCLFIGWPSVIRSLIRGACFLLNDLWIVIRKYAGSWDLIGLLIIQPESSIFEQIAQREHDVEQVARISFDCFSLRHLTTNYYSVL